MCICICALKKYISKSERYKRAGKGVEKQLKCYLNWKKAVQIMPEM